MNVFKCAPETVPNLHIVESIVLNGVSSTLKQLIS